MSGCDIISRAVGYFRLYTFGETNNCAVVNLRQSGVETRQIDTEENCPIFAQFIGCMYVYVVTPDDPKKVLLKIYILLHFEYKND